jgi:phage shock protein A
MPKDAVATLEATREKLIKKLLEKKCQVEDQLKRLGYQEKQPMK